MLDVMDPARKRAQEESGDAAERREHPRIIAPPLDVSGVWATVQDVSVGGICLVTDAKLEIGERCDLILTDGLVYYTKEIQAEVRWLRRPRVGLRWVNLTPELENWLQDRFASWPVRYRVMLREKK